MKRLKLFLMILMLLGLMAAVVVFRSPYAPVAGGPVDIEVLWAIEDARTESEAPLITRLENHGVPLAYDQNENLFYCTLGLENGDEWPQLHLTAPGAQGVSICFSDDYTYDWCDEAIAEGYSYELMAYTDTQYSYFNIVFTGLPTISLNYEGEMTTEDIPVSFEMGSYGNGTLKSAGRAHFRGDGSLAWTQKKGYKVEFTRRKDGTGKVEQAVPGFGNRSEILLLPMAFDETLMLDRLSWEMYEVITPMQEAFSARQTAYAEVFINNEYAGVYLLTEPFVIEQELMKAGTNAVYTDGVYRTGVSGMVKDRLTTNGWNQGEPCHELFYSPNEERPFAALEGYFELWNEEDDVLFAEKALACLDMDSVLRYVMFLEAAGLVDNTTNNLYVWAHRVDGEWKYRYKPWDMDRSWGVDAGENFDGWFVVPVIDRVLNLNVAESRSRLLDIWQEMKEKGFTYENIEEHVNWYTHELNDSGAFARNAKKWGVNASGADGAKILNYVSMRFPALDNALMEMAENKEEPMDFLMMDCRRGDPMVISMVNLAEE